MHVKGFKEDVNESILNPKKEYDKFSEIVFKRRCYKIYFLKFHCYNCHKPIKIDSRKVFKHKKLISSKLFCEDCRDCYNKESKNPLFLKHKNNIFKVFKNIILNDGIKKIMEKSK